MSTAPAAGDALRLLLRESHVTGPSDLPSLLARAGACLGADATEAYLVDYEQTHLVRMGDGGDGATSPAEVFIEGTVAGRVYRDVVPVLSARELGVLWWPLLDGSERLGVLRAQFPPGVVVGEDLQAAVRDVATLAAELVMTRSLYGDAVETARRRGGMTVEAELQWRLLPPLTFVSPRVSVSGVLAPAHEVAGDCFDYAANGHVLHVAVLDAMGHGMEAALLSAVAVSTLRNARRAGADLVTTVTAVDVAIAKQFGSDRFVTGIFGELDARTGVWRWVTCGHHPALLLRDGRVVKQLDAVVGAPMGLGLLSAAEAVAEEQLEPGDRIVLYTDGVTEARDTAGEFFGLDRLVDLVTREASRQDPVAETLRRLNQAILAHQHGRLQDDATTVLVEWLTGEARFTLQA